MIEAFQEDVVGDPCREAQQAIRDYYNMLCRRAANREIMFRLKLEDLIKYG